MVDKILILNSARARQIPSQIRRRFHGVPCTVHPLYSMCNRDSAAEGNLQGLAEWCWLMVPLMLYWFRLWSASESSDLWTAVMDPVLWGSVRCKPQSVWWGHVVVVWVIGQNTYSSFTITSADSFSQLYLNHQYIYILFYVFSFLVWMLKFVVL